MRRPAVHAQEDHALGPRREVRLLRRERVVVRVLRTASAADRPAEREPAEAAGEASGGGRGAERWCSGWLQVIGRSAQSTYRNSALAKSAWQNAAHAALRGSAAAAGGAERGVRASAAVRLRRILRRILRLELREEASAPLRARCPLGARPSARSERAVDARVVGRPASRGCGPANASAARITSGSFIRKSACVATFVTSRAPVTNDGSAKSNTSSASGTASRTTGQVDRADRLLRRGELERLARPARRPRASRPETRRAARRSAVPAAASIASRIASASRRRFGIRQSHSSEGSIADFLRVEVRRHAVGVAQHDAADRASSPTSRRRRTSRRASRAARGASAPGRSSRSCRASGRCPSRTGAATRGSP